jgi:hypothetical protein
MPEKTTIPASNTTKKNSFFLRVIKYNGDIRVIKNNACKNQTCPTGNGIMLFEGLISSHSRIFAISKIGKCLLVIRYTKNERTHNK